FSNSQIKLSVPLGCNQLNPTEFSKLKRRKRKRIEILFSQLDRQFSMNVNFAKTFDGLATRIISKITTLTMSQYLNLFVFNRPLNIIKCNIS
ncbi:MAG: IS982 family transposase, partial [Prevotellaceae bacterium]|nr:IS982 family transposase [Prevotellaceae bacterium]